MQIDFTSTWVYFVVFGLLIGFSILLVRYLPFYKKILTAEGKGRFESLDGLRGILALNVFFQHAVTSYFYFQNGVWEIVPIRFYRHLGGEAVILFFITTSFLYWSKAIAQKGDMDAGSLYRSRFLRLAPMYLFSAGIIIFSIFVQSGFSIDVFQTAKDILSWLSLGLITTTSVNHLTVIPINAGIHWTLSFEWGFYLLLPVLAVALKSKKTLIMALPLAFFALSSPYRGYWAIFFFGIVAAHIYARYPKVSLFSKPASSLIPIVGVITVYFISYKPYSFTQYFVSLGIFLSFVYGADLFGLLKTRVIKFLGTISYSVYLLHGIVLFGVLNSVDYFYPITSLSPIIFWLLILACGIITICVSSLTYYYIEYPFIKRIKGVKKEIPAVGMIDQVM